MKHKILHVIWEDACGRSGWHDAQEEYKLSRCETVGYLIKESRKVISLAQSIDHDCNKVDNVMMIPKSNIKKRRILK